jgi:hypothetical protein
MMAEAANYWTWHLQKLAWIGLFCQILGLVMFLSLWWHQDRGWRVIRWVLLLYFIAIGTVRFSTWLVYSMMFGPETFPLQHFMFLSGAAGLNLCTACVIILILDIRGSRVYFMDFSPEIWSRTKPLLHQWAGLGLLLISLWWPFTPNPEHLYGSIFTFGFPTSFGVTLTPTLLFFAGFFLAGSRHPHPAPIALLGAMAIFSAFLVDPVTLHGVIAAVFGLGLAIFAAIQFRMNRQA